MSILLNTPEPQDSMSHVFGHQLMFDFENERIVVTWSKGYMDTNNEMVVKREITVVSGADYTSVMTAINTKIKLQEKLEQYLIDKNIVDGTVEP